MTYSTEALAAVERDVLQADFKLFVKNAWSVIDSAPYKDNWHITALCQHLQAIVEPVPMFNRDGTPRIDPATGEQVVDCIRRLLINIPPGTAKSLIVSVLFPVWVWTRKPQHKFMSGSYSLDLATRDAKKSRGLVESDWFQQRWPIKLAGDQNQKINFENTSGGSRVAKPFASMTGSRANTVIIDDPHSVKLAHSEADRTDTIETFKNAIPNRINDPAKDSIIVIMQRLHEEDVSGFILDHPDLGYEHLCIPMEYEGPNGTTCIGWTDPRTEDDELLFPQHMTRKVIDQLKASTGKNEYAGQYQQRPVPKTAGEIDIEWFPRYQLGKHPANCNFYMTSDHAPSGNTDYNVFRIWAVDAQRNLWMVDSFRKRCKMDEALGITRVDGKYVLDGTGALPLLRKWKVQKFFPEKDSSWMAVENLFRTALRETGTYVMIDPQPTSGMGDKVQKAQPYIAIASLGQVYIPKCGWGDDALLEYARFPNAKHDDQVDADSMAGRVLSKLRPGTIQTEEERRKKDHDYAMGGASTGDRDSDSFF